MISWRRETREQTALKDALRKEILELPDIEENAAGGAESAWLAHRRELKRRILEEDPREFLTWDVVTGSMFVGNRPFIDSELRYLMKPAGLDTVSGKRSSRKTPPVIRKPYKGYRRSSGNRIHQAYHLARFQEETGLSVQPVSPDRGVRRRLRQPVPAGPQARVQGAIHHLRPARICRPAEVLPRLAGHAADRGRRMHRRSAGHPLHVRSLRARFRDTAGSETGSFHRHVVAQRNGFGLPGAGSSRLPAIDGAAAYLITYQRDFEGVDNPRFFDAWRGKKPTVHWTHSEIPHMPGNFYLFGRRVTS